MGSWESKPCEFGVNFLYGQTHDVGIGADDLFYFAKSDPFLDGISASFVEWFVGVDIEVDFFIG